MPSQAPHIPVQPVHNPVTVNNQQNKHNTVNYAQQAERSHDNTFNNKANNLANKINMGGNHLVKDIKQGFRKAERMMEGHGG